MLATRLYRGQAPVPALDAQDRGLAYGDGVFETLRVQSGRAVWWQAHVERLAAGARRLGIPGPDPAWLAREAAQLLAQSPERAVLKLIYTRGGGRGYGPPPAPQPSLVMALHELPAPLPSRLALRWCETRLAVQPVLAGIKHLNRLEQVLARAEWQDEAVHEGVMLDTEGHVACATAANVFARIQGRWLTPKVDRCGVAGIARAWVMAQGLGTAAAFTAAQLEQAEAVFLCNAVRGILPVAALGQRHWRPDAEVGALQARLARAEPAFESGS